ncbi:MAG TPA: SymE family type I addiction module toxin [Verrucomicrobiae bacterium]|nr:SymE family type I addiction module toxin [Verrucomicrobiae bacterium]
MPLTAKRYITVGRLADGQHRRDASSLRLMGRWLYALGFSPGDTVLVECRDGCLIIRRTVAQTAESPEKPQLLANVDAALSRAA